MVAPAFVLMHLPLLLLGALRGTSAPSLIMSVVVQIGVLVVMATFFRVVIAWLYNGTGRSVLVVALFHSAFNSATGSGNAAFIGELIPGSAALLLIPVGVLAVAAVVITIFTRGRLAYAPEHAYRPAVTGEG